MIERPFPFTPMDPTKEPVTPPTFRMSLKPDDSITFSSQLFDSAALVKANPALVPASAAGHLPGRAVLNSCLVHYLDNEAEVSQHNYLLLGGLASGPEVGWELCHIPSHTITRRGYGINKLMHKLQRRRNCKFATIQGAKCCTMIMFSD